MQELIYTISSTDKNNFTTINNINLHPPVAKMCKFTITGLTTMCSFILLEKDDWIDVMGTRHYIGSDIANLSGGIYSVISILNQAVTMDFCDANEYLDTLIFKYGVTGASYNVRHVTGLYNEDFSQPIFESRSVGFYNSTYVLHLVCNLGNVCYVVNQNDPRIETRTTETNKQCAIRFSNGFMYNTPIITNNVEFTADLPVGSLGNINFQLTDANFVPIRSLAPIYIFATAVGLDTVDDGGTGGS
jgi:hypothetical protein